MNRKLGWLANFDREAEGEFVWQPWAQLSSQCVHIDVWFRTKDECEAFIRNEIIGRGMYPEEST